MANPFLYIAKLALPSPNREGQNHEYELTQMDNHTKGSEQPTSEKKYKSPHRQFGQNDNCPKKFIKSIKQ